MVSAAQKPQNTPASTPPGWRCRSSPTSQPIGPPASAWDSRWQPPRPSGDASSFWAGARPIGPPPHSASSPAAVLGNPVQQRPDLVACPATSFLTTSLASNPSTGLPKVPFESRQPGHDVATLMSTRRSSCRGRPGPSISPLVWLPRPALSHTHWGQSRSTQLSRPS